MSLHSQLRKQFPFLTPPFAGGDEPRDLLNRFKLPKGADEATPKIRVAFGAKGLSGVQDPKPAPAPQLNPPQPGQVVRPPESIADPAATRPYKVGINVGGLKGADRGLAELEMMRQKPLSSELEDRGDTIGYGVPRGKPRGTKSRLAASGKGALLGLERGGPIGALIGAITGGVSPITIDKQLAERALMKKEAQVGRQMEIEKGKAQIDEIRARSGPEKQREAERDNLRQAWQAILASGQVFDPDNPEHKQIHDRAAELGIPLPYGSKYRKEGVPLIRERQNADGTVSTLKSDDNGKTWVEIEDLKAQPKPTAKDGEGLTPYQNSQRQAKAADLVSRIERGRSTATDWQKKLDAEPDSNYKSYWEEERDKALGDATQAAIELREGYGDLYEAGEGEADTRGRKWPYYKPKSVSASPQSSGGRSWSASKWAAANPGGDVEAAKRAAAAKGYRVVE